VSFISPPQLPAFKPTLLIAIAIGFLTLSLCFGFLNGNKLANLRYQLTSSLAAQTRANNARVLAEKKLNARQHQSAAPAMRIGPAEENPKPRISELNKLKNLRASENEVVDLQRQLARESALASVSVATPPPNDANAELAQVKRQLEAAEQEKAVLAEKVRAAKDRLTAIEEEKRRRHTAAKTSGIRGTVLAVNQAYNFVVLSLGDRQGVVPNAEMLVLRDGTFIGKIRISSVEPTTSIGDIISNSLARGVQVQPGDIVIYAGNNNS
jgi:hypothetical protein